MSWLDAMIKDGNKIKLPIGFKFGDSDSILMSSTKDDTNNYVSGQNENRNSFDLKIQIPLFERNQNLSTEGKEVPLLNFETLINVNESTTRNYFQRQEGDGIIMINEDLLKETTSVARKNLLRKKNPIEKERSTVTANNQSKSQTYILEEAGPGERRRKQHQKKEERMEKWGNMKAQSMTPEMQLELRALQMRRAAHGRHHRHSSTETVFDGDDNDGHGLEAIDKQNKSKLRFFQVGTVLDDTSNSLLVSTSGRNRKRGRQSFLDEIIREDKRINDGYIKKRFKQLASSSSKSGKNFNRSKKKIK